MNSDEFSKNPEEFIKNLPVGAWSTTTYNGSKPYYRVTIEGKEDYKDIYLGFIYKWYEVDILVVNRPKELIKSIDNGETLDSCLIEYETGQVCITKGLTYGPTIYLDERYLRDLYNKIRQYNEEYERVLQKESRMIDTG